MRHLPNFKAIKNNDAKRQNPSLKNNFNLLLFSALDIATWDLECEFNNTDHRTELNGMDRLIVRRGQPFSIKLKLRYGEYQAGLSSLTCIAETGS
jgi:hypothetical protein